MRLTRAELQTLIMALDVLRPLLAQIYRNDAKGEKARESVIKALDAKILERLERPEARGAEENQAEGEYFKNTREAFDWLKAHGLKMGKSTFYNGIGTPGFPRLQMGKKLSREECGAFLRWQHTQGKAVYIGPDVEILSWRQERAHTLKMEAEAALAKAKEEVTLAKIIANIEAGERAEEQVHKNFQNWRKKNPHPSLGDFLNWFEKQPNSWRLAQREKAEQAVKAFLGREKKNHQN